MTLGIVTKCRSWWQYIVSKRKKKIAFTYSFHLKDPHVTPFGQRLQLRLIEIISISGLKRVRINHSWALLSFEDDLRSGMLYCVSHTVTESADSGFNPLLRRPQGPQGCLEKQNCPLSSNLVVWCAKIGPKS